MDDLDKLILQKLQEDGRTPFTRIANEAGVSETTIRSRYRNLVSEGVVHTVSIVDPFSLDFQAPAMIGVSVEPGRVEKIAEEISQLAEVSYLVSTLGVYDLIVEVYCRDLPHLTDFVTNQICLVQGVRSVDTLLIAKSYKLSYRWSPEMDIEEIK